MIRPFVLSSLLIAAPALFAANPASAPPSSAPPVSGVVADPTGAIVPGAQVDLVDDQDGAVAGSSLSGDDGTFQVVPPHAGNFTLVVSEPGFETIKTPVVVAAASSTVTGSAASHLSATLRITLPIAGLSTNVQVNADASEDLTASEDNHD